MKIPLLKISPYDKVQAFKRSEKYHKDFRKYVMERRKEGVDDIFVGDETGALATVISKSGKCLCEKWKIIYPVNPDTRYMKGEEAYVHSPITYLDLPEEWNMVVSQGGEQGRDKKITHINGKLVLMIDTAYSTDQIEATIKKILCYWTRRTKQRIKKNTKVNIWDIYDEFKGGKTKYQIAMEYASKHTDEGLPTINPEDKEFKLIHHSYNKAKKIIKAVEKSAQTVIPIDPMEDIHIKPTPNK